MTENVSHSDIADIGPDDHRVPRRRCPDFEPAATPSSSASVSSYIMLRLLGTALLLPRPPPNEVLRFGFNQCAGKSFASARF